MRSCKKSILVIGTVLAVFSTGYLFRLREPEAPPRNALPRSAAVSLKAPGLWIEQVSAAEPAEAVELAKLRGRHMKELIRSDPEKALLLALSWAEWKALAPELQAHVEQPFSAQANVEVLVACGERSRTFIETDLPGLGKMETYVYGRRSEVNTKNGLPVQGIRVGMVGVLEETVFQLLERDDEVAVLDLFPVVVPKQTSDAVAALAGGHIFYFENRSALEAANRKLAELEALPGPDAGSQQLFDTLEAYLLEAGGIDFQALETAVRSASAEWTGTPREVYVIMADFPDISGPPVDPVEFSNRLNTAVSEQIQEMSFGKTHIVAEVNPGTYRLSQTSANYTNNTSALHAEAEALAEAEVGSLDSYDTICVVFPYVSDMGFAGLASVGGQNLWMNGTMDNDVMIHELGHNYGSRHASFWQVTGSDPVDPSGEKIEYGDFMDIMGGGDSPAGHFNPWHKKHIGWLESTNWTAATTSGTYRIHRFDHPDTAAAIRGLQISKTGNDDYWLGLRQEYTAYDSFGRGAYLLWKKSGDNRSYLVDTTPDSADGKYDGGLALGRTYSDAGAGVHITPVARGGPSPEEWMDIQVNFGGFPGNSAPTASISGPTAGSVQESMIFSVSASDSDGDELAYYWNTGDGLVKPNSPTIATAWLSGSTVTVSCVVSDMKGGTVEVSQEIVLSSPLDNWTQRTSGTAKNLNDIAVGAGRLVAVGGNNGTTAYSDDGTNWTVHTSGSHWLGNVYLFGVIYDGSQFVAVGMDHDGSGWEQVVYTSADGTYWTKRYESNSASVDNIRLHDVAYENGIYVAAGDNGIIVRSTDGYSWSPVVSGTTTSLAGISYGDGVFVAVGPKYSGASAIALTSSDGLSWTNNSAGIDLDSWKLLSDIEYFNGQFVAGGFFSRILNSMDQGQTFTTTMADDRYTIYGLAYGGDIFFATGINEDAGGVDINLISADGINWSELSTAQKDNQNAAVYFNGTFITVGDNGSVWQSDPVGGSAKGYAGWQLENGEGLGFNRDPMDDADFDGELNLVEYALGSAPGDAESRPSVRSDVNTGYFQVNYLRTGKRDDIAYTVEHASNLISNDWNAAATVVLEDSETNLTARSVYAVSAQTNEYLRLKVELSD
ncbi:PKD domain-containing protein [Pontiella agarivorans]|uniref:PKD domain-containing protein n=1 Tax=Pontiella agarivorans TaxID=3038953 RepID=A0ABU5MWR2_9BACT|nr:PKD domain-containing protein [Pontiella agarivorans]MDZ8118619.1 PKD domain-containing protein [Pontiella agarivorans]